MNALMKHAQDMSDNAAVSSAATEVKTLAAMINVGSVSSILEFGSDAVSKTNSLTDQILERATVRDLGETGEQLSKIVVAAQEFDFDAFDNPMSRVPVLGSIFKKLNSSKAKMLTKFESVKTQMDHIMTSVENTAQKMTKRDREYSEIYQNVREEYEQLGLYIEAIRLRLQELDQDITNGGSDNSDVEKMERTSILEAARQALSKRADDLEVIRHSAMQTLPMIRIIQSNNYALVDKFATIRSLTLPAWKRAFMMAISIAEQKDANDLAVSIDNTTNALLKRNAELLQQSSIAIAQSNQRLVIDVDTLKSVHASIISTLQDVRKVHVEGAEARRTAILELSNLRIELMDAVQSEHKRIA